MKNNLEDIIDKKVQDTMGDFEVPYQAVHWDKMADKMTQFDTKDAQFDDSLRSRLGNIEKPLDTNHWAAMASRLDEIDSEETTFDSTIRERVERVQAPYRTSHWEIMSRRLDEQFTWQGKVVRYKIVEVGLMLLALFTAFNLFDTEGVNIPFQTKELETEQIVPQNKTNEPKSFNKGYNWRKPKGDDQNGKKTNNNKPLVATQNIDNQYLINSLNQNTLNLANQNKEVGNQTETIANRQNSTVKAEKDDIVTTQNAAVKSQEQSNEGSNTEFMGVATEQNQDAIAQLALKNINGLSINTEFTKPNLDWTNDKKSASKNSSKINKTDIAAAEQVGILRPKALTINALYETIDIPKQHKKSKWWRFGIFGTSSSDIALTDYNVNYTFKDVLNGATNIAEGNKGLGASVGYRIGKIELESGLAYKHKEYTPAGFEILTGGIIDGGNYNKAATPDLIKLNVLSIPLNLNYYFVQNKHFDFYTSVGVAANFAMETNAVYPADINIEQAQRNIDKANADLRKNNVKGLEEVGIATYSKGILDDFKFKNNHYFTAQVALGLEYKLNFHSSIFLQTGYEQHFLSSGIGTRNDRINSFNVQAGAKMRFGNGGSTARRF